MILQPVFDHSRFRQLAQAAGLIYADVEFGLPDSSQFATFTRDADSPFADQTDRRYLIASITKPIVTMALLKLAAAGEITLAERLGSVLPKFSKAVFRRITVRHLLTHTSGFPDMLPNNAELRAANASLSEFIQQSTDVPLEFQTATDCRYSSIGFLLAAAIIEKLSGRTTRDFLQQEFFEPLQMHNSWLGLPEDTVDELLPTTLPCELPEWQPNAEHWNWNSRYWRTLGAPWGGMMSTTADLGRFAKMMLCEGAAADGTQVLPAAVVQTAMSNQIADLAAQPGFVGPRRGWGLGWRLEWPSHSASFGDFLSPTAIGHWGACGTLLWIDPERRRYAAILTTTPYEQSQSIIQQISNMAAVS
ncbi:MAG: serine hydrolase domain-containing protein [Planctomycetaceae bacterium]